MGYTNRLILLILLFPFMGKAQSLAPKPSPATQGATNTLSTFNGGLQSTIYFRPPRGFHCWVQQDSAGMFWFDSGGTNTMYYHNGTTRVQIGSGGGGSYSAGGWLGLSGSTFYLDTANKKATSLTNADNFHFITPLAVLNANNTLYSQLSGMVDSVANLDSVRLADTAAAIRSAIPSVTGLVPYNGATQAVNLGNYDLTVQGMTVGKGNAGLSNNTVTGYQGLFHITSGNYNTSNGYQAGHNITTGNYNTAIGQSALFTNTTGGQNTAVGLNALLYNLSATGSTAIGVSALEHNSTGAYNIGIGYNAGSHITGGVTVNATSDNSIYIGRDTRALAAGGTNEVVIGGTTTGNGSNTVTIGNSAITQNYFNGAVNAGSFVKNGGTSAQYLMADGSTSTLTGYATTSALADSVSGRQKYSDTSTFDATRSWVASQGYGASTTIAAGTGISVAGSAPAYTVTNTAPDQTVSLTGAGTVSVTGTYPTFTVTGTGSAGGVASITSTNSTAIITGTTTVNVEVDTTHPFTFTGVNTFTRDITVDSVSIGTGNGLSTSIRFGRGAFAAPTTATGIVALGENTARLNTTGQNDIYVGRNAGGNTGTAVSGHVGIGTGNLNYSTGDNNTGIGFNVLAKTSNWNGIANVFCAINTGNNITSGSANSVFGSGAGAALTSSNNCTLLGVSSGSAITTGGSDVILGSYTGNAGGLDIRTLSNRLVLSDGAGNIRAYHNATNWLFGTVTDGSTGLVQISGSLGLNTAGNKINIATGSNAAIGTATLVGGTVDVNTTAITASSVVMLTGVSTGAPPCATCGALSLGTIVAGTRFTINSSLSTDTRVVQYIIFN